MYSGFYRAFFLKTAACCGQNYAMKAMRVNQNRKVMGWTATVNTELKLAIKLFEDEESFITTNSPLYIITLFTHSHGYIIVLKI